MVAVNESDGGTASTTFVGFPIQTAGKTGTADVRENQTDFGRKPYAVYAGYAPQDDPQIAVVAVAFDGGHGTNMAPVIKSVYEQYFKDKILQLDPNYASKSESFQKYVVNNPFNKK